MRGHSKGLVVLAAGALLLTLAFFLVIHRPTPTVGVEPSNPATHDDMARADGVPVLEAGERTPDAGARDSLEPREVLPAPSRVTDHSEAATKVPSRDGPGRLVVSAVDAETRVPVERFRVRAASATRIADRQSDRGRADLRLTLTPDTYSLLVLSQGYEPTELPPVRVSPSETATVDPVPLRAGSARIAGVVIGSGWSLGALRVELLGEGRRPCDKCPIGANPALPGTADRSLALARQDPCRTCGYAAKSSLLQLPQSGLFTFENLASGSYALRLVDGQNRPLGGHMVVDLRAAESLPVELQYAAPRTVRAEIIDTDGTALAKVWADRIRATHPIDVESNGDSSIETRLGRPPEFQCAFRMGDDRLARSSFFPPAPFACSWTYPSPFSSRRLSVAGKSKASDDRLRANSELLEPERQAPTVEPWVLPSHVDEEGLVCFDGVPSLALTLDMQCEPFVATIGIPPSRDVTRVRVQLTNRTKTPPPAVTEATNPTITFQDFEASIWH